MKRNIVSWNFVVVVSRSSLIDKTIFCTINQQALEIMTGEMRLFERFFIAKMQDKTPVSITGINMLMKTTYCEISKNQQMFKSIRALVDRWRWNVNHVYVKLYVDFFTELKFKLLQQFVFCKNSSNLLTCPNRSWRKI